jgi:hypothetical protein
MNHIGIGATKSMTLKKLPTLWGESRHGMGKALKKQRFKDC